MPRRSKRNRKASEHVENSESEASGPSGYDPRKRRCRPDRPIPPAETPADIIMGGTSAAASHRVDSDISMKDTEMGMGDGPQCRGSGVIT